MISFVAEVITIYSHHALLHQEDYLLHFLVSISDFVLRKDGIEFRNHTHTNQLNNIHRLNRALHLLAIDYSSSRWYGCRFKSNSQHCFNEWEMYNLKINPIFQSLLSVILLLTLSFHDSQFFNRK